MNRVANRAADKSETFADMYIYYLAWENARKDVSHVVNKYLSENRGDFMDFIITGNFTYAENIRKDIISEINDLIEQAEYIITYNDNKEDNVFWREYAGELYTLTGREVPDHLKCVSRE